VLSGDGEGVGEGGGVGEGVGEEKEVKEEVWKGVVDAVDAVDVMEKWVVCAKPSPKPVYTTEVLPPVVLVALIVVMVKLLCGAFWAPQGWFCRHVALHFESPRQLSTQTLFSSVQMK
jgi:hypothetical protein